MGTMFGLGVGELLLLAGIIVLIGGPTALSKVVRTARKVQDAKSQLTGKALLGKVLDVDADPDAERSKKKRKRKG